VQLEHLREYDEAIVALKAKVRDLEGQDMREAIQDKVCRPTDRPTDRSLTLSRSSAHAPLPSSPPACCL